MNITIMPHYICEYMYNITTAFHSFFFKNRCINYNEMKEIIGVNNNKILVCMATEKVLQKCFDILGIELLERM